MTPAELQKAEQGFAVIADTLPPFWKRMYDNLMSQGFDKDQAMTLLVVYIKTSLGNLEK